ncbi:MAG: TIGR00270 family protein [Thermoplasmata archaeon]|nr:MAG: TIGR00270 family protein [Thermoplasmata archaeon]
MLCEMCGQEVRSTKKIDIEGSLLSVCQNCARFGKEPEPPKTPVQSSPREPGGRSPPRTPMRTQDSSVSVEDRLAQRQRRMQSKNIFEGGSSQELIDDYHKEIQRARMQLGMNQEELARKLNERKSIIAKLETRSIRPDNKLIRKLEKTLKISLMENVE